MKTDPYEVAIMQQCQLGLRRTHAGWTGSWCRKRELCREEGRCHIVAAVQRYEERTGQLYGLQLGGSWASFRQATEGFQPTPVPAPLVSGPCCPDTDICAADCPRHHAPSVVITWDSGVDGYAWAL